jgi:uncharacterized membrane protein YbaN (DUF454 family)
MMATLREACGMILMVAGLLALPIPVVPGVPFIAAGAALLGNDHPRVRSVRTWLQNRGWWSQKAEIR